MTPPLGEPLAERLAAIEARLKAATEGPWAVVQSRYTESIRAGGRALFTSAASTDHRFKPDADFVAHSWEDIRDLLSALKASVAGLERYTKAGQVWGEVHDCSPGHVGSDRSEASAAADLELMDARDAAIEALATVQRLAGGETG